MKMRMKKMRMMVNRENVQNRKQKKRDEKKSTVLKMILSKYVAPTQIFFLWYRWYTMILAVIYNSIQEAW